MSQELCDALTAPLDEFEIPDKGNISTNHLEYFPIRWFNIWFWCTKVQSHLGCLFYISMTHVLVEK